jgi:hypothetical protein
LEALLERLGDWSLMSWTDPTIDTIDTTMATDITTTTIDTLTVIETTVVIYNVAVTEESIGLRDL